MIRAMSGAGRQARASCDRVLRWRKALWKSQARTSRHLSPPKRLARVARLLPRTSRRSWRPEIPPRRTSPRSPKRRGHFRSTFSEATPAGRFAATGSAAPRAGGRLSATGGCGERTIRWSRSRGRRRHRNRGEPVVKCPAEAIARRPTSTWRGPTCGSSGRCSRPPARGPASEYVALQQRGSSGPVNESIRAGLGRPLLDHGPEQSRDVASPHCCFDEPARGPSACSRPGGGRLSKRITLLWSRSLRLAKHQRGSGSPASMASDSWIAASMQQSDAEIDTIAARPEHQ